MHYVKAIPYHAATSHLHTANHFNLEARLVILQLQFPTSELKPPSLTSIPQHNMPDSGIFTVGVPITITKAGGLGGLKVAGTKLTNCVVGVFKAKGTAAMTHPVQTVAHSAPQGTVKATVKQATAVSLKKTSAKKSVHLLQHVARSALNAASQQSAQSAQETVGEAGLAVCGVSGAKDYLDKRFPASRSSDLSGYECRPASRTVRRRREAEARPRRNAQSANRSRRARYVS